MKLLRTAMLALLAAVATGAALTGMPDSEPLVAINGKALNAGDLKRFMALQPQPARPPAGSAMTQQEFSASLARRSLDALIERQLLLVPAREDFGDSEGARASLEAFAERQVRDLEDRAGSRLLARQLLGEQGLTVEQYKQFQIDSALISRFLWNKVYAGVAVKPAELRDYYKDHSDEFRRPRTLVYRQVLFTVSDPREAAARRAQAEQVLKQLKAGADFAQLADRFSADREKYPGGLHQVELPEGNADWRPPILEGLSAGQVSGVQQVGESLAIAKFEGILEPRLLSFGEVQGAISDELLQRKRADAQAAYVEDLKRKARVEYLAGAEELGLHGAAKP